MGYSSGRYVLIKYKGYQRLRALFKYVGIRGRGWPFIKYKGIAGPAWASLVHALCLAHGGRPGALVTGRRPG